MSRSNVFRLILIVAATGYGASAFGEEGEMLKLTGCRPIGQMKGVKQADQLTFTAVRELDKAMAAVTKFESTCSTYLSDTVQVGTLVDTIQTEQITAVEAGMTAKAAADAALLELAQDIEPVAKLRVQSCAEDMSRHMALIQVKMQAISAKSGAQNLCLQKALASPSVGGAAGSGRGEVDSVLPLGQSLGAAKNEEEPFDGFNDFFSGSNP